MLCAPWWPHTAASTQVRVRATAAAPPGGLATPPSALGTHDSPHEDSPPAVACMYTREQSANTSAARGGARHPAGTVAVAYSGRPTAHSRAAAATVTPAHAPLPVHHSSLRTSRGRGPQRPTATVDAAVQRDPAATSSSSAPGAAARTISSARGANSLPPRGCEKPSSRDSANRGRSRACAAVRRRAQRARGQRVGTFAAASR